MIGGFRWVEEWENLQGILTPPALARKTFLDHHDRERSLRFPDRWRLENHRARPVSLSGLVKVGMFDNNAAESTGVSIYRKMYWESDTTNQFAFLSEIGLEARYQLTPRLSLKAGYQAISLKGSPWRPARSKKPSVTAFAQHLRASTWCRQRLRRVLSRGNRRLGIFVSGRIAARHATATSPARLERVANRQLREDAGAWHGCPGFGNGDQEVCHCPTACQNYS